MRQFLRLLKWDRRPAGRRKPPQRGTRGLSPYHRRLACESLETRTLLSVSLAGSGLRAAGTQGSITASPFLQEARLTASDGAAYEAFGKSVSISGNTLVVGAGSSHPGTVYIFTELNSDWVNMTQIAKLTVSDGAAGDTSVTSVAISGNTVVVGVSYSTVGGNSQQGAAYVFVEPVSGWTDMTQTARLTASDGAAGDWFGASVSISGNTVVVGAPNAPAVFTPPNTITAGPGAAYIFTMPASGWANMTQAARLSASGGAGNDFFGASVSISGDTVVAGANGARVGVNSGQGVAYVYVKPASGWTTMTQTARLTASDGAADDYFGWSVSISGNTVVVGAPNATATVTPPNIVTFGPGAAYVFAEPVSGWANMTQTARLTASDGVASDQFGYSLSISGDTVVVGAWNAKAGGNMGQGAAYLFTEPGSAWTNMTQTNKLTASNGAAQDYFGTAVAIDRNTVAVGSPDTTVANNTSQGAAYVFVRPSAASIAGFTTAGDWWAGKSSGSSFVNQYWGSWGPGAGWQDIQVMDVNGDGKADIAGRTSWGAWYVAISTGTNFVNQYWGNWSTSAGWQDVQVADFNGDGKADLVGRTSWGAWYVAISTGTSFVNQYWGGWSSNAGWQEVHAADFNGDGKADLVGRTSWGAWYVALSSGTSFINQYWGGWSSNAGWQDVHAADFNGDGKADILGRTSWGAWYVALSAGTGFANQLWGSWNSSAGWTNVQVADVNGDGKADIVGRTSWGAWYVALSTGTSSLNQYWGGWNPGAGWTNVQAADVNGDGSADVVGMTSSGAWYAAISTGTSFVSQFWGAWNTSAGWQPVLVGAFG